MTDSSPDSLHDSKGFTALELAVRESHPKLVEAILRNYPAPLPPTLLHQAVMRGDVDVFLLVRAAYKARCMLELAINYRPYTVRNPLEYAIVNQRFELANLILENKEIRVKFSLSRIAEGCNIKGLEFILAKYYAGGERGIAILQRKLLTANGPLKAAFYSGKDGWPCLLRLLQECPQLQEKPDESLIQVFANIHQIAEINNAKLAIGEISRILHNYPDALELFTLQSIALSTRPKRQRVSGGGWVSRRGTR